MHFNFGKYRFDNQQLILTFDQDQIEMRHKLKQLLQLFLLSEGKPLTKATILQSIWPQGEYRERSLSQSILELRKLLGDSAQDPKFIRTIPGEGYQWIIETEKVDIPESVTSGFISKRLMWIAMVCLFSLIAVLSATLYSNNVKQRFSFDDSKPLKIAISPFVNLTADKGLQWIEYGLSDMLAVDLGQFKQISTHKLQSLSEKEEVFDHGADVLISVSVDWDGEKYQLSAQMQASDGTSSIVKYTVQDLAYEMPNIASFIHRKLRPNTQQYDLDLYDLEVAAMHEYAKGKHAKMVHGCTLAQHYFAASMVLDQRHKWSQFQYATCLLELNQFEEAEKQLISLSTEEALSLRLASQLALTELYLVQGAMVEAKAVYVELPHSKIQSLNREINFRYNRLTKLIEAN